MQQQPPPKQRKAKYRGLQVVPGLTDHIFSKAFFGIGYFIYPDENYSNVWSAGSNTRGGCGVGPNKPRLKKLTPITYFTKHGIKIKKISVNISVHRSFFISKDNKLYASGDNYGGQLGIASKKCIYELK